ncbi:alpha/beta hydrolase [Mycolicibacterium phlei]
MSRPTVAQAEAWRPDALARLADDWELTARKVTAHADTLAGRFTFWTGAAADAAQQRAHAIHAQAERIAAGLLLAACAARDGAEQLTTAVAAVTELVTTARAEGFTVTDTGQVLPHDGPSPLLVALSGGDATVARRLRDTRAATLTHRLEAALTRLGSADDDAAADIAEALALPPVGARDLGDHLVAGWPTTSQAGIEAQIAAMTPDQRRTLVATHPAQVGNTDGVPWELRVQANRTNIATAALREADPDRLALYRELLAEVDDPAGARVDRQILGFDPARASLIELHGDLSRASGVAVLVPGLNTTLEGSRANTATARRFVTGSGGDVAAITYLGGPFPRGDNTVSALAAAADPRYALEMAPRLVAFTEDVDRRADATGRRLPVTVIGHSYGGSIVGTAETRGLTADRVLYVAAAGAGVGVDDPGDWRNRNPHVVRYSMTPPGDWITLVQGIPGGPHGADPDEMPGVIRLGTGRYDDGRPMAGPDAHSDVINAPSDSWRTILGVITGEAGPDRARLPKAG